MNNCPCCSTVLLKHGKQGKTYWYCSSCRQEMPNLELIDFVNHYQEKSRKLLDKFTIQRPIASPNNR